MIKFIKHHILDMHWPSDFPPPMDWEDRWCDYCQAIYTWHEKEGYWELTWM